MRYLVILGSPRRNGNTAALAEVFVERLRELGEEAEVVDLLDCRILPCNGCGRCQDVQDAYGCPIDDDMEWMVEKIRRADCLVLATPIYSWYCTAQMKALLDRHYGMNKYYGRATGSLWAGKSLALITTHGYGEANANGPFEEGMRRLCKHSKLYYRGRCSARDMGKRETFLSGEAREEARSFAQRLTESMAREQTESREIIIEGKNFQDMDGFYREMGRLLSKDRGFEPGHNLDALSDLLRGGFGVLAFGEPLTIRWHDFTKSSEELGEENILRIVEVMESSRPEGGCAVNTRD